MANTASPVSRILLVCAFAAVGSSAGLQWVQNSAQTEAARQQASRHVLAEFSSALSRFESVPAKEKPAVAEHLTGLAERLSKEARGESLASASRRVVALASYEDGKDARDAELHERLRAEVRGLVNQAESMETQALGRATLLSAINQVLLLGAVFLCGIMIFRTRRAGSTA